ncbi:MAG: hypothetical protein IJ086_13285 [Clostridium sp.]|nr:hypothetical protein [Clostridium sp.]
MNKGYYKKEDRNGYYILVKPAQVLVTLTNNNGTHTFNMKNDILNYYSKQRISQQLLKTFQADVKNNKIIFYISNDGNSYSIK